MKNKERKSAERAAVRQARNVAKGIPRKAPKTNFEPPRERVFRAPLNFFNHSISHFGKQ